MTTQPLDPRLLAALDEHLTSYPALAPRREELYEFIAARTADVERLSELVLVFAALAGEPGALARFEENYLREVPRYVRRVESAPECALEICQRVRARLLLSEDGELPRLTGYRGAGPLAAFVRMVSVRVALNWLEETRRRSAREARALDLDLAVVDMELELTRRRHRESFRRAFEESLRALEAKDRTLLRMHVLDGLTFEELGRCFGVNRSTVCRWLGRTRALLAEDVKRRLQDELGSQGSELESLIGALRSAVDLSLRRLLVTPS